jgi:5-methylcytosine-specific restriction endonuclease McrA
MACTAKTAKEAKCIGEKRYFTGKPCIHGHIAERKATNGECIECSSIRNSDWYKSNKEWNKKKHKKYNQKYKEEISARRKQEYKINAEAVKEKARSYYAANKEEVKKRNETYAKQNRHIGSVRCRNRRARQKLSIESHSASDVNEIRIFQKNKCANCGISFETSGFHVDHIYPLSKGGSNGKENIQLLCPTCNLRKHAKDPIDWARENGRLL